MKALLVLALTVLAAASAYAYGPNDLAAGVRDVVAGGSWPAEPAALLVSGGALIGLGGLVKRFSI